MQDLGEHVRHHVRLLSGAASEDAWHSLVEAGPDALPYLIAAFDEAAQNDVRVAVLRVIAEYRSPKAIPFLVAALANRSSELWETALDGLVMCGSREALEALLALRGTAAARQREWIEEAITQVSESLRPG